MTATSWAVRVCSVCGDEVKGDNAHHAAGPAQDRDHVVVPTKAATTLPPVEAERRHRLERIAKRTDELTRQRDKEIALAYLSGASLREIAEAVGLSHTGVKKIIDRTRIVGMKPDMVGKTVPLREAMGMDIWEFEIVPEDE